MDDLSDEDLRKQLKAYGKDVGPINNSTRPYWRKALSKLLIEHNVSPITSASKKEPKKKKIIGEEKQFVRSPKLLVHNSECADQSISDEDLSDSENDSIVTDSPGSTPFPAKSQRTKKSPLKKNINNSLIENLAGYNDRKNCHHSTTPSSSRTTKVKRQDNKSILTQPKDGETRKKFKERGVQSLYQSPMNDMMREQWKKLQKKQQSDDFKDYQNTFENAYEHKFCFQESRASNIQLGKCIKKFLTFALKGIFFAVLIIIGISFIISSEDIKRIEEGLN